LPIILHIETATSICSVTLSKGLSILAFRENNSEFTHSSQLTVFMDEVIREAGITANKLDAVSVSIGPGSYTGLRIGLSAAKGLCYAIDKPLIAVNTLLSMTAGMVNNKKYYNQNALYCPMLDARRMEVYCALYDSTLNEIRETKAEVVDEIFFSKTLKKSKLLFFGDGADKCKHLLNKYTNALFVDEFFPSSKHMVELSLEKYKQGLFENIAYVEPFYLKEFIAGKPNVKGLRT